MLGLAHSQFVFRYTSQTTPNSLPKYSNLSVFACLEFPFHLSVILAFIFLCDTQDKITFQTWVFIRFLFICGYVRKTNSHFYFETAHFSAELRQIEDKLSVLENECHLSRWKRRSGCSQQLDCWHICSSLRGQQRQESRTMFSKRIYVCKMV